MRKFLSSLCIGLLLFATQPGWTYSPNDMVMLPTPSLGSAATVTIANTQSVTINITGTTTISSFGSAPFAGVVKYLKIVNGLTITYNATSMITPTGTNLFVPPGAAVTVVSLGGSNWVVAQTPLTTPVATTNAKLLALQASAALTGPVMRLGVNAIGDAPVSFWWRQTGTCFANGMVSDIGSCNNAIDNNSFVAVVPDIGLDLRQFAVVFDGNTGTDNTTQLQASLNWMARGNSLLCPAGTAYHASAISATMASLTASGSITGPGKDVCILGYTGNSGTGLTVNYVNNVAARNSVHFIGFTYCTTRTGAANGILLSQPANVGTENLPFNDLNITLRGCDGYAQSDYWNIGLKLVGVFGGYFANLMVQGPSAVGTLGHGVELDNGGSGFIGQYNFSNVTLNNLSSGIILGDGTQGVVVAGSNFTHVGNGILNVSGAATDQLVVSDSQFNCVGICVQATFGDVFIHDTYFILEANNIVAVYLPGTNSAAINHCSFRNGSGGIHTGQVAVRTDAAPVAGTGITLAGNIAIGLAVSLDIPNAVAVPVAALGNSWGGAAPSLAGGATTNLDQALPFANVITPANAIQPTQLFSNSNTNTWGANIAGGGANVVMGLNNGTNWTVMGK